MRLCLCSHNSHAKSVVYSFGFAKFFDVRDSEKCIRGFYRLGYEVGFARVRITKPTHCCLHIHPVGANEPLGEQESFNSRLKAEGDEGSTNLYISNLPKSTTEMVGLHQGYF